MLKTLLAGFIALTCMVSYADLNSQPNQNSNSADSSSTLDTLPAKGAVQFVQPWARPTTNLDKQVSSSAMYLTLVNTRGASYKLINISSDKIGKIEIHQTITDDKGVSKMVKVDYPFLISGNINVDFKPGGMHIMLYDPKKNLNIGDSIDITFFFDDNTVKTVNVKIATDNPYNTMGS